MSEIQEFIHEMQGASSLALAQASYYAQLAKGAAAKALGTWTPQLPLSREVRYLTKLPMMEFLQETVVGFAGREFQHLKTDPKLDAAVMAIRQMLDEMQEREKQFRQELETLELAYQCQDMRRVDHYIEEQLGLNPRGLCATMRHYKLDEGTMRDQLRIALREFLRNKDELIKDFHTKASVFHSENYLVRIVKNWLFWRAQKWAQNHVQCLKPWTKFGARMRAEAEMVSLSSFECEETLSRLIEEAMQERYYRMMTPEAILLRQEEDANDCFAWQQRYALLNALEQELARMNDPASRRLAKLLELMLSGKYTRRREVLEQGFTESNWNALKQRIRRRARHLQPLAA